MAPDMGSYRHSQEVHTRGRLLPPNPNSTMRYHSTGSFESLPSLTTRSSDTDQQERRSGIGHKGREDLGQYTRWVSGTAPA